jgi:hypothetical protein
LFNMILSPDSSGHPQLPESTTDNTTTMSNHREPALNLGTYLCDKSKYFYSIA